MAKKSRYLAYAEGMEKKSKAAEGKAAKPQLSNQNRKTGSVMNRLSQMKEKAKEIDRENKKKKEDDK